MKKKISQSVFIFLVFTLFSTKITAQRKLDFSKPLSKKPLSETKDTTIHEKNLLFVPTRDGDYQVRNLFYNPQKDGKVGVVLLNDNQDVLFSDLSSEKIQFDALLSVVKLRQIERLKKKETCKINAFSFQLKKCNSCLSCCTFF